MANEKRLIYADAFCMYLADVQLANRGWKDELCGFLDDVMEALDDAPTVDAVEVVRCRDCKYFSRDEEHNRAWCNYYSGCLETAVNGYCYHGAKMDGDGNA